MSRWGPPIVESETPAPTPPVRSRWGPPIVESETPAPTPAVQSRWGPPIVNGDAAAAASSGSPPSRWGPPINEQVSEPSQVQANPMTSTANKSSRWGPPLQSEGEPTSAPKKSRWGEPVATPEDDAAVRAPKKSRWGEPVATPEDDAAAAELKKAMEIAEMRASMLADFRAAQKARAEAKGKGKGGTGNSTLTVEPECKWAKEWRKRIIDTLPHGNDACSTFDADTVRSLVLELWDDVAKGVPSAVAFFSSDATTSSGVLLNDSHTGASTWAVTQSINPAPFDISACGSPAEEVVRIWPGEVAPQPSAAAVLRLDGRCFDEKEVIQAYKKLSRLVHPDKTHGIPNNTDAFQRLSESSDELKTGLKDAVKVVQRIEFIMGMRASEDEDLQRPHAKLFAMSLRLLLSVIGLSGEGRCLPLIKKRAAIAFENSVGAGTSSSITKAWFDNPELLGVFAMQLMRTAFECAPKQYRAQFICALSRAAWVEEATGELMRENWAMVFKMFPEIPTWRLLETRIRERTWAKDSTSEEPPSPDDLLNNLKVAVRSVRRLSSVGKTGGEEMQTAQQQVQAAMKAAMAGGIGQEDILAASNPPDTNALAAKWAFVAAADMLLSVGDGMVGITYEGAYVHHKLKKSVNGVWASVTPPPGVVHIDFEVRQIVQEFDINDPGAIEKLLVHCLNRPNSKTGEIGEIRAALRSAGPDADLNEIFSRMILELIEKHGHYQTSTRDAGNRGGKGAPRMGGGGKGPSSQGGKASQEDRSNDWNCSACGERNFAKRMECYRCGNPRYSGGSGRGGEVDNYGSRDGGRDYKGGRDDYRGGRDDYRGGRDDYSRKRRGFS